MNPNQKNALIAVLSVAFLGTAAASLVAVKSSNHYRVAAMRTQAAAMQRELRGANSGDHAQSAVPAATATKDPAQITAAAKAQGKVEENQDNEDDPGNLDTATSVDAILGGGAQ